MSRLCSNLFKVVQTVQIVDLRVGLPISNPELPISNPELPISNPELSISNSK
jgi:hypothetical protein